MRDTCSELATPPSPAHPHSTPVAAAYTACFVALSCTAMTSFDDLPLHLPAHCQSVPLDKCYRLLNHGPTVLVSATRARQT
jgi:hypothetical protein